MLTGAPVAGRLFGITCPMPPAPDVLVADNDALTLGRLDIRVLFTPGAVHAFLLVHVIGPGHSPGHVCFHVPAQAVLFGGDMVFRNSVGRTDLPLCSGTDMIASLRRLMTLPHNTTLCPGHMGLTTMAAEHASNPFFASYRDK